MKIELSSILIILSILAIVGGFLLWVLGLVLTDKKDKMMVDFRLKNLEKDIIDHRKDIENLEQKTKHL